MKRGLGRFGLSVGVTALILGSLPAEVALSQDTMALAQVEQPSKEAALQATMAGAGGQPSKEEAFQAVGEVDPLMTAAAPGLSACSLCSSCGGDWPTFSGVIPTRFGARPYERGPDCAGSLAPRSDTTPYLCCRH